MAEDDLTTIAELTGSVTMGCISLYKFAKFFNSAASAAVIGL